MSKLPITPLTAVTLSNNNLIFKSQLKSDFEKMSVKNLQSLCGEYGLTKTGNKSVIIEKIINYKEKQPTCRKPTELAPPTRSSQENFDINSVQESSKHATCYEATSQKELIINDIVIQVRYEDGYVNATQLGKAMGKQFNHWYSLENTKELIEQLSNETGIPGLKHNTETNTGIPGLKHNKVLIEVNIGGNHKGSWIHPDLVVPYTMWGNKKYAITVSRYMRELHLTGSVSTMNGPKSSQDLLSLQQELMSTKTLLSQKEKLLLTQTQEFKNLNTAFMVSKSKHSYYKFQKGGSFYLISDAWLSCNCENREFRHKVGIEGVDINRRLAEHRTTMPSIQLDFLMYTEDYELLEKCMLRRFKEQRKPFLNHEYIYNIPKEKLIQSVIMIAKYLKVDYCIEDSVERYNEMIRGITNFEYEDVLESDSDDDLLSQKDYTTSSSSSVESKTISQEYKKEINTKNESANSENESTNSENESANNVDKDEEEKTESIPSQLVKTRKCDICNIFKELIPENFKSHGFGFLGTCNPCFLGKISLSFAAPHLLPENHIKLAHIPVANPITHGKTKTCNVCKRLLSIEDFGKNKTRADGYEYDCRDCASARKNPYTKYRFTMKKPEMDENQLQCAHCKEIKLKTEFRTSCSRPSGYQSYCIECAKIIGKKYIRSTNHVKTETK